MSKWQSVSAIELVDYERTRTIWRFQAEYWFSTGRRMIGSIVRTTVLLKNENIRVTCVALIVVVIVVVVVKNNPGRN